MFWGRDWDTLVATNLDVNKNIRELSWMSHRVIRFWFLLTFLFISAFFDILASLLISCVFSRGFSGRPKSSCLDNYQMWLCKLDLMCEKLSYQIINTSTVNQAVFCYYQKFAKIIIEKKTLVLAVARNEEMHFFEFT